MNALSEKLLKLMQEYKKPISKKDMKSGDNQVSMPTLFYWSFEVFVREYKMPEAELTEALNELVGNNLVKKDKILNCFYLSL